MPTIASPSHVSVLRESCQDMTCSVLRNELEVMQGLTDSPGTSLSRLHMHSCIPGLLKPLPVTL